MNEEIKVSVIIPCFNESKGVIKTFNDICDHTNNIKNLEMIFVNDGSTDDTAKVLSGICAKNTNTRFIENQRNLGYGASLKKGILSAQGEVIVITDADGTYPANEICNILKLLETCDMAIGARIGKNVQIPILRRPAKWLLLKYARWMARSDIKDLNSGLRAFRKKDALSFFHLLPPGFSFTSTITLAMHIEDYRVKYHTIDYRKRIGKSSIKPIQDTFAFFTLVLRTTIFFRPLQVFGILAVIFMTLSILLSIVSKVYLNNIPDIITLSLVVLSFNCLGLGLISDLVNRKQKEIIQNI